MELVLGDVAQNRRDLDDLMPFGLGVAPLERVLAVGAHRGNARHNAVGGQAFALVRGVPRLPPSLLLGTLGARRIGRAREVGGRGLGGVAGVLAELLAQHLARDLVERAGLELAVLSGSDCELALPARQQKLKFV